ncbi:3-deoxy-D-manno-octulosonic-acid transferase [Acidocella aminolytica 101 = DSM 11237]|nr:3-deoxy-D-manno-octulosonic acid transferase [Acidocella aminolytica]GBQ37635.1 3-deoxy-D-manno-octulosonic-acid transferase [Acidocella aminolytica 101 = DSM 11237]SHE52670.1 3-deoxy-D-manno-octulosonic-acid transferase [Acidocella aminolytica 101 = DSM 11237]
MILGLYAGATRLAPPVLRRMLRRRAGRGKEVAGRLGEREGFASLPRPEGSLVWVHAASVGETMSALPLIKLLAARGPVLLTTGTVTSALLAAARLPEGAVHQFVPLDVPQWGARFLEHWHPDAAVFLESEIWPNLLLACEARGIRRFLVNGRISAASTRNWRCAAGSARRLLGGFAAIHAQSTGDAAHFRALGAARVLEWGNLKFFAAPLPYDEATLAALQAALPGPVWLAASTHPGEEILVYEAHQALLGAFPGLVTILAPRHPERGAEVAALCGAAPRRALGQPPVAGQVYVADTLGELGLFFRLASFAFIGNSLAGFGGHNIVEPALLSRPVISGPHLENFQEAAARLRMAQALAEVQDAAGLAGTVRGWLTLPEEARAAGQRAAAIFAEVERLPERLARLILDDVS